MTRKEDSKVWLAKYADGYTKQFVNPYRPMGNAVHHGNAESKAGRNHGAVLSITCLAPESLNKPMKSSHNGTMEASITVAEKEEKELVDSIQLADRINEVLEAINPTQDSTLDNELYELLVVAVNDIEKTEKLLYKLMDFSTEKDGDIYDSVFLKEFVKRIRRSLYVLDDDLKKIEENLNQEEEA